MQDIASCIAQDSCMVGSRKSWCVCATKQSPCDRLFVAQITPHLFSASRYTLKLGVQLTLSFVSAVIECWPLQFTMSEKDQLLPQPSSGSYYSLTSSGSRSGFCQRLVKVKEAAENNVKQAWARAVHFIHAREFFAEFLGTFILVVSHWGVHDCATILT